MRSESGRPVWWTRFLPFYSMAIYTRFTDYLRPLVVEQGLTIKMGLLQRSLLAALISFVVFNCHWVAHKKEKGPMVSHGPLILLVPRAGLEPARGYPRGILSPLRLPIPPPRLGCNFKQFQFKMEATRTGRMLTVSILNSKWCLYVFVIVFQKWETQNVS